MIIQFIHPLDDLWVQTLQNFRYDIYHLPEYVSLEAYRTDAIPEAILVTEDERQFFVPYLLRRCDRLFDDHAETSDCFDVVSPYGYPGILLNDAAINSPEFLQKAIQQIMAEFSSKQICSAFFRLHPILNKGFEQVISTQLCQVAGETVSVNLELSETEIWSQTRSEHRNKINRTKRAGFRARIIPFEQDVDEFITIYNETMDRVNASESYYFDRKYFLNLSRLNQQTHLCIVEHNQQVACAGLFTECCGIVQYHLGGTKNQFLKQAPSKLMFDHVRFWAKERGNRVFHLGGGVSGTKDSLYHFKAGFSKQRHTFLTLRFITDEIKYNHLVELQAKTLGIETEKLLQTTFFPAYRSIQ
ncbi:GNAT family N-acetyltransferase [Myxacorys almedinensis]|uniref:GNAT family N-acetyltransferase n=1 Tax=Myxacorys almedinensis A TaxID=2690445 RepID=A0A8J7Z4W4_9CYAN|nr:GNAT family N-acetyltransferase [Myxacorys almedinensis]NDJ17891.1 GNAT family N-acetyltransferase [Myxacorys almedinensis A]